MTIRGILHACKIEAWGGSVLYHAEVLLYFQGLLCSLFARVVGVRSASVVKAFDGLLFEGGVGVGFGKER